MHKVLAALGLAVAVPVALATPALAKPPVTDEPSVSSVLRQHEGFRAEVTYLCTGPKHQEGTINVSLQQPAKPGASNVDPVGTAHDEAKCDGKERGVKIKIPVAEGAVQADQTVRLYTTLVVNGDEVATHLSDAEPVAGYSEPAPSSSPTETESESPRPSPTTTESGSPETETASSSPSPSKSGTETPTPSPTATP
jgi:hypothetical protein